MLFLNFLRKSSLSSLSNASADSLISFSKASKAADKSSVYITSREVIFLINLDTLSSLFIYLVTESISFM